MAGEEDNSDAMNRGEQNSPEYATSTRSHPEFPSDS
jgi:hypothetical protein